MDLEHFSALWAPWRVEYFNTKSTPDFLLEAARTNDDAAHLVVARRKSSFLMMNRYPYAVGHLMAVPYRKAADLSELTGDEKLELWDLAEVGQKLLREAVRAQGFNIGVNLGECAGAGVPDHLHIHVVPRWNGDTNFMPVIAGTGVVPDALKEIAAKLRAELGK